jgi:predicted nucleotidyltransferase
VTALEIVRQGGNFSRYKSPLVSRPANDRELEAARTFAKKVAEFLKVEFHASRVILFGSLARGHDFEPGSDIDLAAWGIPPAQFFSAVARLDELNPKWKIDLVDGNATNDRMMKATIEPHGIEL